MPGHVNLEYRLPNGAKMKFLDDQTTYLGSQLKCASDQKRYFGVLAHTDSILVSTYGKDASDPELILYRKR